MADITVRLYRQHDMDLINLYRTPGYRFQRAIKDALVCAANGISYTALPPAKDQMPEEGYVPKSMSLHFLLNPKRPDEKKALEMLYKIKKGQRCSYLKALFRKAAPELSLSSYFDGDGLKMHYSGIQDLSTIAITEDETLKLHDESKSSNQNSQVKNDVLQTKASNPQTSEYTSPKTVPANFHVNPETTTRQKVEVMPSAPISATGNDTVIQNQQFSFMQQPVPVPQPVVDRSVPANLSSPSAPNEGRNPETVFNYSTTESILSKNTMTGQMDDNGTADEDLMGFFSAMNAITH